MRLSLYGRHLTGRFLGRKIINELRMLLDIHNTIRIDFGGVQAVSHSFIDEVFGGLVSELGVDNFKKKIKLNNCSEEFKSIILFVLKERSASKKRVANC
ncbi:MAG: hypothetical protein VR69_17220 [Peptococcaceae bacterium BRH_c4b]|nr:MAG: hypothetical protein VR69_17220 [Peptococcaceae bacterium BRH_c4b]